MKVLLSVLIILNLIVIWFFIIKGNVRFSFGADKKKIQAEAITRLPTEYEEIKKEISETKDEVESLVPKSVIRVDELRKVVSEILPDMVKNEVAEALHESDVEFDDSPYEPIKKKFKPVDDIDKAFTDERVATPATGQQAAQAEDDESVPAFDELDRSLKIISDKKATPEQKAHALKVAVTLEDSNIIVALPEPLHSQLVDMFSEYHAKEIDSNFQTEEEVIVPVNNPKPKKTVRTPQKIPDDIKDFNPSNY